MGSQSRWGLTLPLTGMPLAEQRDLVASLPDLGYTDVWSAELNGIDAFTPLTLASQWAPQLRLGTAIVGIYTRAPVALAVSAGTLASLAPGRFVHGHRHLLQGRRRAVERHPVREAVPAIPRHAAVPARSARRRQGNADLRDVLGRRFPARSGAETPPALALAALRPGMVRLAAAEAGIAITNWLAPDGRAAGARRGRRRLRAGRPDLRLPDDRHRTRPGTSAAG